MGWNTQAFCEKNSFLKAGVQYCGISIVLAHWTGCCAKGSARLLFCFVLQALMQPTQPPMSSVSGDGLEVAVANV